MADSAYVAAVQAGAQPQGSVPASDPLAAIGKQTKRVEDLEAKRALPRTLMGGTAKMIDAGEIYLPRHPAESSESYESRKKSTVLFGAFSKTVAAQTGKLFVREVVLNNDVPTQLGDICDDIDGQGHSLSTFIHDVVKEAFVDGVSFYLVDFPRISGAQTLADQQEVRARPYFVHVPTCNVLGWKVEQANGKTRLVQLRFKEYVEIDDGDYLTKCETRVRVLEPGAYTVFREVKRLDGTVTYELIPELSGTTTWQDITFVPVYANQVGYLEGLPPLRELAELNQEHWISSSEQRRALTFLRFAMLVITGVDVNEKIAIGPDKVLKLTNAQGKAEYVEHSGAGIEAGRNDLLDIEKRMEATGMELRIENMGRITATAAAINSAESNATLLAIAKGVEASIELGLEYAAKMLKLDAGGSVEVYDEFAQEEPPGDVAQLQGLYISGLLSRDTVWRELQRRHVLDVNFDFTKEAAQLATETPVLQGQALPLNQRTGAPNEQK